MKLRPLREAPVRASLCLLLVVALTAAGACRSSRKDCPACLDAEPLRQRNACSPYTSSGIPFMRIDSPSVLFLSGGGAHGAWGAGVMSGWVDPPDFEVVTGISTGALQAPLVFLGTDAARAKMKALYTETSNGDIYRWNWLALFGDALQSRAPLEGLIDENLDDATIAEIAAISGRELWVGTVNMDTSQFCPWNLSLIAQAAVAARPKSEKRECLFELFRDVVFAASGAPVLAPPVMIDGGYCERLGGSGPTPKKNDAMHVDGGARLRVFAEGLIESLLRDGGGEPLAYVVMNGKMSLHEKCIPDRIIDITARTFEILMSEGVYGNLHYLRSKLGDRWKLRLSRIPADYCLDFGTGTFDPEQMTRLFEAGSKWVKQPDAWGTAIPPRLGSRPKDCKSADADCSPGCGD